MYENVIDLKLSMSKYTKKKKILQKAFSQVEKLKKCIEIRIFRQYQVLTDGVKVRLWLRAVKYHCENFQKIKEVASTFDPTSAISLKK